MAQPKCKKTVREDNSGVDFAFIDGTVVAIELADLDEAIQTQLTLHGASQKGGDSYAGCETVEDAIAALQGVVKRLLAGDWRATREGGAAPRTTILILALCKATGKTEEECREKVASLDEDAQKELKAHPAIDLAIKQISAERAAARAAEALAKATEAGVETPPLTF